mmetsp:Transcript_9969/g.14278  ORF Transcript_9969/g.14278 Transcript_9969/m.14278 type:complete len:240 (-) Transcript_9969:533-1252(-)
MPPQELRAYHEFTYDVEKRHKLCSNIRQWNEIDSFDYHHSRTRVFHLTISNLRLFFVNFNSLECQSRQLQRSPLRNTSSKGLTSASRSCSILSTLLRDAQRSKLFGSCGVDSNSLSNILKLATKLHSCTKSLHDFSCVGSKVVQSQYLVRMLVHNGLTESLVRSSGWRKAPLQGNKVFMVHSYGIFTKFSNCIIFRVSNSAVLQRCENSRTNISIIHSLLGSTKETARQGLTRMYSHGR